MTIVFVSNYYNHHQQPLSEMLYKLTDGNYYFIATSSIDEERLSLGWKNSWEPFVLCEYLNDNMHQKCQELIDSADVVIYGSAPEELFKRRLSEGKLTFKYSERVYKAPCKWYTLPARTVKYYWKWGRFKNLYLLCASAYAAEDYAKTRSFIGKCYKWGYFPPVYQYDLPELFAKKNMKSKISLLWVGRFIDWKHPEIPIHIADDLKNCGLNFEINMIGSGELSGQIECLVEEHGLQECVYILGSMSPEEVRIYMEAADIFLMTSDRKEGWGAVLNEAMNSGCAVIANKLIGSVPYLIEHEKNGFIYDSE